MTEHRYDNQTSDRSPLVRVVADHNEVLVSIAWRLGNAPARLSVSATLLLIRELTLAAEHLHEEVALEAAGGTSL